MNRGWMGSSSPEGGSFPAEDMEALGELGVGRLFGPGTSTSDAVAYIRTWFEENGREATGATG